MMKDSNYDRKELDELDNSQGSSLLGNDNNREQPEIPFCGCLSIRYYQPYFDVDTADVTSRIANALIFCKREQNFLSFIGNRPDAYGPVWVITFASETRCSSNLLLHRFRQPWFLPSLSVPILAVGFHHG